MTSDADAIVDLYRRHALAWDGLRGRSLLERPWLDRFAGLLPPRAAILDVGCGSGDPIGRYFVTAGYDVTGIDTSPDLIGLCKVRLPGGNWIVADMRELSLGRRFDGLIAWDSFFHLRPEEQRRMFGILRRHAGPSAALMFTCGPSQGEAVGSFQGEPLYHASLDPSEYRSLLNESGFSVVAHVAEDPQCGGHTIWLAQLS